VDRTRCEDGEAEPLALAPGPIISDEDREYWAFQPIQKPAVPKNVEAQKMRTPVDAFVLAKMGEKGLQMAPEADRRTLIRRVTLDLTGLLPTPEEVEAFVADKSPLAYEQLVERCWPRKTTASAGRGIGWMSWAMPIQTVTPRLTASALMRGAIATM
jgi:hypothetical protein